MNPLDSGPARPDENGDERPNAELVLPGLEPPGDDERIVAERLAEIDEEMTDAEFRWLTDQRKLPSDHPSAGVRSSHKPSQSSRKPPPSTRGQRYTRPMRSRSTSQIGAEGGKHSSESLLGEVAEEPIFSSVAMAMVCLHVVHRSGVLPILEARLSSHRGQKSIVTVEALLLAALLAAWKRSSYRRADLCAVLNGLDPRVAVYLGLCDSHGLIIVSYDVVDKQILRLEELLYSEHEKRLAGEEGHCFDMQWLADKLVMASIPPEVLPWIRSAIVDSSAYPTYGKVRDFTIEEGQRRKLPKDVFAEHRKKVLEDPDLKEPKGKRRKAPKKPKIGQFNSKGRLIRSHDPHATGGHRSATSSTKAEASWGTTSPP